MDKKEVTPEDFIKFWELFAKRHPELDMELPQSRVLVDGSIYCNQPAKMDKERYDIYFRFLRRWYMDNGYMPFEPDFVYVSTADNKAMEIDTAQIISTEKSGENLTKVEIKEGDIISTITIEEDLDYFNGRVYIF